MIKAVCRRCRALAMYEVIDSNLSIRCPHCGDVEWIRRETPEGMVLSRVRSTSIEPVKLPARNSRLYACLIVLADYGELRSQEASEKLKMDKSKVGTSYAVLASRGLVVAKKPNQGKKGGSLWALTDAAKKLIGE